MGRTNTEDTAVVATAIDVESAEDTTAVVVATVVDAESPEDAVVATAFSIDVDDTDQPTEVGVRIREEKQGRRLCGCCCDYRLATFVLTFFGIVVASILIVEVLSDPYPIHLVYLVPMLVTSILGWVGALRYSVWMLAMLVLGDLASIGFVLWRFHSVLVYFHFLLFIVIVTFPLFLRVHVAMALSHEIRQGIMSEETYATREAIGCGSSRPVRDRATAPWSEAVQLW